MKERRGKILSNLKEMTLIRRITMIVLGIIIAALACYLIYALVYPEKL
ncbi:MAG: K(+)-transporting ATPase subunit F [Clostridiales bacterium]|nr:K(+)-transporting ATPase subunit F [Clostridiales bacterium]